MFDTTSTEGNMPASVHISVAAMHIPLHILGLGSLHFPLQGRLFRIHVPSHS
jgi:hypothetical protein